MEAGYWAAHRGGGGGLRSRSSQILENGARCLNLFRGSARTNHAGVFCGNRFGNRAPADPVARAIAVKRDKLVFLMSVETPDRGVQTLLRIDSLFRREWIADALRPTLFLERGENEVLLFRWLPELFHHPTAEGKYPRIGIPARKFVRTPGGSRRGSGGGRAEPNRRRRCASPSVQVRPCTASQSTSARFRPVFGNQPGRRRW